MKRSTAAVAIHCSDIRTARVIRTGDLGRQLATTMQALHAKHARPYSEHGMTSSVLAISLGDSSISTRLLSCAFLDCNGQFSFRRHCGVCSRVRSPDFGPVKRSCGMRRFNHNCPFPGSILSNHSTNRAPKKRIRSNTTAGSVTYVIALMHPDPRIRAAFAGFVNCTTCAGIRFLMAAPTRPPEISPTKQGRTVSPRNATCHSRTVRPNAAKCPKARRHQR